MPYKDDLLVPAKKRKAENCDFSDQILDCFPSPVQQPVHTGYIIVGHLLK